MIEANSKVRKNADGVESSGYLGIKKINDKTTRRFRNCTKDKGVGKD